MCPSDTTPRKIAVLADIHSNDLALSAVLEDARNAAVDAYINLGDAFNSPINPKGVASLLMEIGAYHVRGNGDRLVLESEQNVRSRSASFARESLSKEDLEFLATWPAVCSGQRWMAFHGTPSSDELYLVEDVSSGRVRLRGASEILRILGSSVPQVVMCGHSHLPHAIDLSEECLLVNPWSVGLQAYRDDNPVDHKMETGSPHARYAILENIAGSWSVSLRAVTYDWDKAASVARDNGFPDWSRLLITGCA
jgi:predicted phosphodiesterase